MPTSAALQEFARFVQAGCACTIAVFLGLQVARGTQPSWARWWAAGWALMALSLIAFASAPAAALIFPDIVAPVLTALSRALLVGSAFLFAAGALRFAGRRVPHRVGRLTAAIVVAGVPLVYWLIAVGPPPVQMLIGAPLVAAFAVSSWALLRMPRADRTPASTGAGILFALGVFSWTEAVIAATTGFRPLVFAADNVVINAAEDILVQVGLGLAMAMLVMDRIERETASERGRQIAALRASEANLAGVIDSALDGLVTLDAELRVLRSNAAAGAIFGVEPRHLVGIPFERFVAPETARAWREDWGKEAGTTPARRRFRARRVDGTLFPAEVSIAPIDAAAGGGWVLIVRDETDAERAAHERERLRQRLTESQRLETIGRLVSGVAHELNNPLAAILAFAEELKLGDHPPDDAEAIAVIEQQSLRCRAIVRDLLHVARRRELRVAAVSLGDLLDGVRRGVQPLAARMEVTLAIAVPPTLPPAEGEASALEQVFTNLVTNAVQASPRGGRVDVTAELAGDRVVVRVTDEGAGIPPDVRTRLFEPFFTTKAVGEGTGLGLAVSRGLVENLGGTLVLENRMAPEQGACATVVMPVSYLAAAARPDSALGTDTGHVAGDGRGALVVDDEPAIRGAIARYLERNGWRVDQAGDGLEALGRIEAGPRGGEYTVIVCDLRMPRMTGMELHDELAQRQPEVLPHLVILTGDVASPQVAEFLQRTTLPVVEKPFDLRTLDAAIRAVARRDPAAIHA